MKSVTVADFDKLTTGRLGEVVAHAKGGLNADAIAGKMGIMKSTVKTYLYTARSKGLLGPTARKTTPTKSVKLTNGTPKLAVTSKGVSVEIGPSRNDGRVTLIVHAPLVHVGGLLEHLTARYIG